MIVAPNSPSARAQVITMPPKSALAESGSVMRQKTPSGAAPSTAAACSSSRSTVANALIADGRKVFKLGLGQSPFPVPPLVVQSLREHAAEKEYQPVRGLYELRRAVAKSEAMGAMGELLAGVAHEVRNPLFAITALLDAWSLKAQVQEGPFLPALRREVTRMRQLMEELLEYGRPFNPKLMIGDLRTVANEAVRILSVPASERAHATPPTRDGCPSSR